MWLLVTVLFLIVGALSYLARKYNNPYKLTFIFGKKGAGKSCYMVHEMLRYMKRGFHVYTDMEDCRIPGVRIVSVAELSTFRPEPNSALFLDEVGISMDNRNFKNFPPGLRDFFKYLRKMKCVCYINSQAFDVDKKVRDTTDKMVLQVALLGCFSLSRPIIRTITLTESTSQADSRIADNLNFSSIWTWRLFYMPRYFFRTFVVAALVTFWLCVFTFFLAPVWLCAVLFLAHIASVCLAVLTLSNIAYTSFYDLPAGLHLTK